MTLGGAAALLGAFLAYPPEIGPGVLRRALVLVAITTASELIAIRLTHGSESELITLFEMGLVADLVLLPPALGPAVAVAGLALALALQRRTPVKAIYNIGQYALAAVAAAAVYHGIGGGQFEEARGVVGLVIGSALFAGMNLLTISAILSATEGRRLLRVLAQERGLSVAIGLGNSAVGIVAVALYQTRPVLVPAVLAPALALHLAFRGWVRQKELSRRMEEEKIKLERVVEHSSEGIVLATGDGAVLVWSPSMERMTGVSSAEAAGKALPFLLRGRGSFGEPVQVRVSTEPEPFELEVVTASGESRWLRVQHGPASGPDGRLAFDVVVVNDVTRQREIDRLKDDFVSIVSHELRTPLTPIKGYASLLLRRSDDMPADRKREALEAIVQRTDHMARLVEDLLLVSQIAREGERRLPEVGRRSFDVAQVAEKALRSFRLGHPHRDFQLDAPAALAVAADPMRTEQVLAHLISNAVKFSEEGAPVEVRVSMEGVRVRLDVRDEGRGIPADRFEEIFEKFKRLEDPLKMTTGGAGLGLYIVSKLTQAMGGEVAVESEVGRGSTFMVWLPAGEAAGGAEITPGPRARESSR
ncbi:MAG: PAS domain S-box protein [Acidobacteria bacterium]|nr:PAS domain S-box protein [Acidobacteriota bacterium]